MDEEATVSMRLNGRELNAIKWAGIIMRGVEENFGEQAGTREGEATSDVLAGIVARADFATERGATPEAEDG